MDNSVTIVGRVLRPPLMSTSGEDKTPRTRLTLVVTRRWNDMRTKEPKSSQSFFEVSCFGELAENVKESCTVDDEIVVMGKLTYREFTEHGNKNTRVEILADHVALNLTHGSILVESTD